LAVVLDGTGLSTDDMQRFARWTNLAETTFLLPPAPEAAAAGADYQVRIFTTAYEMPFAGHPTLGSCHAWLEAGGIPRDPSRIVQQCEVGLVTIRRDGRRLAFAAPPLARRTPTPELLAALAQAFGISANDFVAAQHQNNGPSHFGVLLKDAQTVLELEPDAMALHTWMVDAQVTGVGFAAVAPAEPAQSASNLIARANREARAFQSSPASSAASVAATQAMEPGVEVRFFTRSGGVISEDPVTGSFNASLAQWLIAEGHAPKTYLAAQGTMIGREGRVHIAQDAQGQVWVGGDSVTCVHGQVTLWRR
jgi:PhzF family phenazine biosynthesis protein